MIGTTVGNYRVVERLGEGGMGAVYRAVDVMLDREVAVKVLKPELVRTPGLIERFRLEAIALARLNHPRIATLHGLERHGDLLLMVMEYVRGDTLEAVVRRSGRIAWPRACALCAGVLEALDHAHDKGVVHRDIKPANVMLAASGAVKVMDFGIARLAGQSRQTKVGHAVGTPTYMAPEQLRGEEVDGRTDLYAVGAVLFELVTGEVAFQADSDYALMMKQLHEPPPAARARVPEVPDALDVIIRRAMAKAREDRFADALAFRDALLASARLDPAGGPLPVVHRTPAPAETRLASPTPPDGAAADAAEQTPPTRLAGPDMPATRLAGDDRPVAPGAPVSGREGAWLRDWRPYAMAATLLVAAGVGVRVLRPPAPMDRHADTGPGTPQGAATSVAHADGMDAVIAPPKEDLQALRVLPPQGGGGTAPTTPPASTGGTTPPRVRTGGGNGARSVVAAPPAASRPPESAPSPEAPRPEAPRPDAPRPEPPRPDPVEEARAAAAREAMALEEIRGALGSSALQLSGGNPAAATLLEGALQQQWRTLLKEGRIAMTLTGDPQVDLRGARATATFDATVNVRSPFGANRRRTARFVAELQRSGEGWRVVGLRPEGPLELK